MGKFARVNQTWIISAKQFHDELIAVTVYTRVILETLMQNRRRISLSPPWETRYHGFCCRTPVSRPVSYSLRFSKALRARRSSSAILSYETRNTSILALRFSSALSCALTGLALNSKKYIFRYSPHCERRLFSETNVLALFHRKVVERNRVKLSIWNRAGVPARCPTLVRTELRQR